MKLVILDRDGVINQDSDQFIKTLDEWIPLPGSIDAIVRLSKAGFTIAIITNQSGIARGLLSEAALQQMHNHMLSLITEAGGEIHSVLFCPHGPDDNCDCRKPKPGLFEQLLAETGTPDQCWVVGDSLRDLEAGAAVGCQPLLVKTGKGEKTLAAGKLPKHSLVFEDLSAVSDWLLSEY